MTLPAHLQSIVNDPKAIKIANDALKAKYEVEEIDCDQLLAND